MLNKLKTIKSLLVNNKSIIENYFFMTILQILNSFFYLLIYPYLIRVLGVDGFGIFVFATSIATYFLFFINWGLDLPATKAIAENVGNKEKLNGILSDIFTAKTYLFLISLLLFIVLLFFIPLFWDNKLIFGSAFLSVYSFVLFPQWFFQGIQKMKVVTYIQLCVRILSLPLIFLLVREKSDLAIYAIIVSGTNISGAIIAFLMIRFSYGLKIILSPISHLKKWFVIGQPFFLSSLAGSIKEYSIPVIIGSFFGMKEVAVYDLANKIISVPRLLFMSVNAAIFPKLIVNIKKNVVKRIIKIEALVAIVVVSLIIIFGESVVLFIGRGEMNDAYYLSILLSITIVSWLVVGAYINFVFIPNNKTFFIAKNQFLAMSSFFILSILGLLAYNNILVFGLAVALSGIVEIAYCLYVTNSLKLLND
ncbi:oligosaccharide flippase family protein [Lonepinella sp. BR2904]|uniref:oligosaccharide flippase family protein n=1 Tax=Lonepinella sp. BR2904 TaxID=3434551 RepID=UPI003F6DB62C